MPTAIPLARQPGYLKRYAATRRIKAAMSHTYELRYFFEYGAGPLWALNDAAERAFGISYIAPESLPLSEQSQHRASELAAWFNQSLNQDYPPDPSPWRQDECDRFNDASAKLLAQIRAELGGDYNVIDEQASLSEDPRLDEYLENPNAFRHS